MYKLNPIKILVIWLVTSIAISAFSIFNSGESAGGEQIPLTTIANFPILFITGAFIITLFSLFFYREWLRSNKWGYALFVIILVPMLFMLKENTSNKYSFKEEFDIINGDSITQRTEYYNIDIGKVRSVQFFKNNKKDSIWKTYSNNGNLIKMQTYKSDTLISAE